MSHAIIQIFVPNSLKNFNFILYSKSNRNALIFDPFEAELIHQEVTKHNLNVVGLLNTHAHGDHIRHNQKILDHYNCPHIELLDQEVFKLDDEVAIKALYTPGHIDPHFCFLIQEKSEDRGLISGDVLFQAGVGNCRNGGDVNVLYNTIQSLVSSLSDDIIIYPSHDYFENNLNFAKTIEPENKAIDLYLAKTREKTLLTTLKEEKLYNPFLRLKELKNKFPDFNEKEIFIELRSKRDKW